jgi:dolichyl-phosphate-mannose-protein mannosyltransferase
MNLSEARRSVTHIAKRQPQKLYFLCAVYVLLSALFGSMKLDTDEFASVREPYEILGGDYTAGYLGQQRYADAIETVAKSYYFYWKYRPLWSPIVSDADQRLFREQEIEFGYVKPEPVARNDDNAQRTYESRLIVPEPDRFYSHGAGKPLLSAVLSIPQLALVQAVAPATLLHYQYGYDYHPIFILTRLVQLLAGLFTLCLVYRILREELDEQRALLGAAVFALFPMTIKYFPNLHHDSLLAPFLVLSVYLFCRRKYVLAGVAFGLALAAKNVAIFLIPVFIAAILLSVVTVQRVNEEARDQGKDGAWLRVVPQLKGCAITIVVGVLCLLPFANPVSYASEVLTPLTNREFDPRGQNVEVYMLAEQLSIENRESVSSIVRPEIQISSRLLRLGTNDFFLVALAVLMFCSKPRSHIAQMAFLFLLMSAPLGLVFGDDMNYRSLQFVPFFAIVCAHVAPKGGLLVLVAVLAVVALLYCLDPITTDSLHLPVDARTLWGTLFD